MRCRIVPAALALALSLAACGTGGAEVAAPSSSAETSQEDRSREFARCMRDNGVDVPDPDPAGGKWGGLGKVDRTDPDVEKAIEACREFMPGGGDLSKLDPEMMDRLREFTQCLRDNGVEVSDPDPNGGKLSGLGQVDRDSPAFQAAMKACQDKLPVLGR
ncbi:hypothetical protein [Saccharothrix deserti]|uniref:hypothetical protein n=1 Tax=Saccharothrix deserti TaxID=2593674 RepID=UPI00131D8A58|nr:hypothetical protein [Saccharothrix deserti]